MAYTYLQAAPLARNKLTKGVMLSVATTNELISMLPWVETTGTSYDFSREGALASVEFVALDATSLTESSSSGDQASVPLRLISSDLDIYNYASNLSDPNGDPKSWQIAQKLKALGLHLQGKMITGANVTGFTVSEATVTPGLAVDAAVPGPGIDTDLMGPASLRYTHAGTFWAFRAPGDLAYGANVAIAVDGSARLYSANASKWVTVTIDVSDATADGEVHLRFTSSNKEPDGMAKLCHPDQVVESIGANGDALSFDVLDQLILEKVKIRDNLVFCMNAKLKRKFLALSRTASGGLTPGEIAIPVLGMDGKVTTKGVPAYGGIPILQVDDIPSTEVKGSGSTLSSVYLASLTPKAGFYGVVQAEGSYVDAALDPYRARIAGVRLYDIGQRESKPAAGTRVEWYGAFGVGSKLALARASELVTA
jgi:hypothetical protein